MGMMLHRKMWLPHALLLEAPLACKLALECSTFSEFYLSRRHFNNCNEFLFKFRNFGMISCSTCALKRKLLEVSRHQHSMIVFTSLTKSAGCVWWEVNYSH